MTFEDEVAEDNNDIARLFARHFSSVYSADSPHCHEALNFEAPQIENPELLNAPFTERKVISALSNLDANKSADPGGIPAKFWKQTARYFAAPLTVLFNQSLANCIFHNASKIALVTAIHKSGLRSKVDNYRQVSLLSCIAKIMDKLMCVRLTTA